MTPSATPCRAYSRNWGWRHERSTIIFLGFALKRLIIARADIFVLARLYSATTLGLYTVALSIVIAPSTFFTSLLSQALFPALSSFQDDKVRLNRIVIEVTSLMTFLGLPATIFMCLSARSLLTLLFGAPYAAATAPLTIACVVVFLTALNAMPTGVLLARGIPALHRQAVLASAGAIVICIYPASKFLGTVGAQLTAVLAILIGYSVQIIRLRSITRLKLFNGSAALPPAPGSVAMFGIILGSRHLVAVRTLGADLGFCIFGCVVAYAICALGYMYASRRHDFLYSSGNPNSAVSL
jgi:O-antigen/teichoic acid export membrane protein